MLRRPIAKLTPTDSAAIAPLGRALAEGEGEMNELEPNAWLSAVALVWGGIVDDVGNRGNRNEISHLMESPNGRAMRDFG
jgi:hypothetical protein